MIKLYLSLIMQATNWTDIQVIIMGKVVTGVKSITYDGDTYGGATYKDIKDGNSKHKTESRKLKNTMKKLLILILLATAAISSRAQTVLALADSSFAHKDYNSAFSYYAQVVKADTSNIRAYRRMGFCFMNFDKQELNATRFFNMALKLQPNDATTNYYMGVVFIDEANRQTDKSAKDGFKAKAVLYLNRALTYGSEDIKAAVKALNVI